MKLVVLASGGGTDFQSIIDEIEKGSAGILEGTEIAEVISDKEDAYALERGKKAGIPAVYIGKHNYPEKSERISALLKELSGINPDFIVLAGYLSVVPPEVVRAFPRRIINIHPALIPKFCGPGFYGHFVHEAVIAAGEKESGATVHYVDEGVDTGEIIMQEKVPVLPGDTAETLAARVLELEHSLLPRAIAKLKENM